MKTSGARLIPRVRGGQGLWSQSGRAGMRPAHGHTKILLLLIVLGLLGAMIGRARVGPRVPSIHDEFSYLLAADTFAHGRLTNPTPPLYAHFETMHQLMVPTYASKYPPAQGLVMAVGQVLFNAPAAGVWLSIALMVAAAYWMMLAWTTPQSALLGALLMLATDGVLSYWSQTYWGGAVAATGGALLFGGARRLAGGGRARAIDSLWLGVGLAILANSRPVEGLVAGLLPGVWLAAWLFRRDGRGVARKIAAGLFPAAAVLALTAAGMLYYNHRVTGSAFRMPYQEYMAQYVTAPLFLWQKPPAAPSAHNPQLAGFAAWELGCYLRQQTLAGFWDEKWRQLASVATLMPGVALLPALLALPWLWGEKWLRQATLAAAAVLGLSVTCVWLQPHYVAPVAPLIFLLAVEGLRRMSHARRGRIAAIAMVAGCAIILTANFIRGDFSYRLDLMQARQRVIDDLQAAPGPPGRDLVLVRYAPGHDPLFEWVFNTASLADQPVLWARELNPASTQNLIAQFPGRRVWLLVVKGNEVVEKTRLSPFEPFPNPVLPGSLGL